jgi:hypothetical protein
MPAGIVYRLFDTPDKGANVNYRPWLLTVVALGACSGGRSDGPTLTRSILRPSQGQTTVGFDPAALELSDGRVAMVMGRLRGLLIVDFTTGKADTIGRLGAGPGEFQFPRAVFRLSPDRYGVFDAVLQRITTYVEPATRDTIHPVPPGHQLSGTSLSNVFWHSTGSPDAHDSIPLIRTTRASGRTDTIARLAFPRRTMTPIGRGTAINLAPEYAPRDVWGALPDGRVWIARGSDNRIDWISADGRLTRGGPRSFEEIRTVDADRHKYNGLPAVPTIDTLPGRLIAPVKAPFQEVVADDNGELWVWLNQPAGYTTERYHRVNDRGVVLSEIELPGAHKILAVSSKYLYVLSVNADDEHVLSRHPKP